LLGGVTFSICPLSLERKKMEKKKEKMASKSFDDKALWNALQSITEDVNDLMDAVNHQEDVIIGLIKKVDRLCSRIGI